MLKWICVTCDSIADLMRNKYFTLRIYSKIEFILKWIDIVDDSNEYGIDNKWLIARIDSKIDFTWQWIHVIFRHINGDGKKEELL